jgi:hypothetical protein
MFRLACVQTCAEAHPASYPMGTEVLGGKALPDRDADHSPPSSAEVKNEKLYGSSHPWPLHAVAGSFTFFVL